MGVMGVREGLWGRVKVRVEVRVRVRGWDMVRAVVIVLGSM